MLDEIILDLFSYALTGESQKKPRNHDIPECVPEWRFEIYRLINSWESHGNALQWLTEIKLRALGRQEVGKSISWKNS